MRNNATGDIACDSYHLYKSDVALAKSIGVCSVRFTIDINESLCTTNYIGVRTYKILNATIFYKAVQAFISYAMQFYLIKIIRCARVCL